MGFTSGLFALTNASALLGSAMLDRWAKAMHDRDLKRIMAMYAPGNQLVAYDIVPPLQYVGHQAYSEDYRNFVAGYKGPIDVAYPDMHLVVEGNLGCAFGLERLSGTLTSGKKSDMWVRFTSVFRKIGGRWFDVHDHVSVPTDFNTGKSLLELKP